eukprot:7489496-Pyramimonas_sp.AAC.1
MQAATPRRVRASASRSLWPAYKGARRRTRPPRPPACASPRRRSRRCPPVAPPSRRSAVSGAVSQQRSAAGPRARGRAGWRPRQASGACGQLARALQPGCRAR